MWYSERRQNTIGDAAALINADFKIDQDVNIVCPVDHKAWAYHPAKINENYPKDGGMDDNRATTVAYTENR